MFRSFRVERVDSRNDNDRHKSAQNSVCSSGFGNRWVNTWLVYIGLTFLGGAERLVVDAAVGLQRKGHKVVVYTSHHDPKHCFEETRDGTLEVRVRGNTIVPRTIFGYLYIVCAILRQLHLTISLLRDGSTYDIIFVDQLSTNIPLMRLKDAKIFFFCHFPDKLLATRGSLLKRAYRAPIDTLEEVTTACADSIVVNSKFTQSIFKQNFPHIRREPSVLYPGIDLSSYDGTVNEDDQSVAILKRLVRRSLRRQLIPVITRYSCPLIALSERRT